MDKTYYNAVAEMEKMKVDQEYLLGWMGGYLHNPMREEQRVTQAYEAGYNDGTQKVTANFSQWVKN